jgi:hypothetical protein
MLKRIKIQTIVLAFAVLFVSLPAQASVWRSSTGNIFRFQNDGTYTVLYANGASYRGNWWWVQPGYKGEYIAQDGRYLVYIEGQSARVYYNDRGNPSYWSYLGSRGAGDEDDTESGAWFMEPPKFAPAK